MRTAAIRQELLISTDEDLQRRRKLLTLSALGLLDFAVITLYQSGAINRLPELPFKAFDSNRVNAAPEAYRMGAPDGAISTWLYATAILLAAAGGTERSGRKPALDVGLGTVVAANAAGAVYYLGDMVFKQKKICPYCIAGALINFASAAILAPTVRKSIKKLFT